MKEIEISDDFGTGTTLLCEKHYKKLLPNFNIASQEGVSLIIRNTHKRGCVQCMYSKAGASAWCGVMFKVWRGCRKSEKANDLMQEITK